MYIIKILKIKRKIIDNSPTEKEEEEEEEK